MVGVALAYDDALERHAEPSHHELRERRLMALAIGLSRERDFDEAIVLETDGGGFRTGGPPGGVE